MKSPVALLATAIASMTQAIHQEAKARKITGNRTGSGKRTLYTYWGGARRIRTRGRPAYNKSRENARRLGQMMRESARAAWREHQAEIDRQQQAAWDAAHAA